MFREQFAVSGQRRRSGRQYGLNVVEEALAEHLAWERTRLEGLAAIDAYYREHGYPAPHEVAAADARVAEEERLIQDARAALQARRRGSTV